MPPKLAVAELGHGEPLVLLHGIATDHRIWSLVAPELAVERRVVTPDLPGFGSSAPVGEDFELERVAERVARGLAGQGVTGPFDLVGHSLGGGVAIVLAATRPRLIRRLVLVAPAGLRPLPSAVSNLLAAGADAVLAARRSAAPLADVWWGRRVLLGLTAADGAQLPATLARQLVEASATARRTGPALAAITSTDLRPMLSDLHTPVGVIWGEADLTVPIRMLDDLLGARPDAVVARVAGAGHIPMVERPHEFVTALRAVLTDLSPAAT
jgi:pimeloyl-ACP methyl ester carboxylesterase